jgi:hypothetical protein
MPNVSSNNNQSAEWFISLKILRCVRALTLTQLAQKRVDRVIKRQRILKGH